MIPVAAVARPRQGIRVPAMGAPPLSAGTITAEAGDGKATINETAQPQGGSGTITRSLYRSTTLGQIGMLVGTVALPHVDEGRTNGSTYHYTIRYSARAETADSNQASATPSAAGTFLPPNLASHDFEDGTLGPFTDPWNAISPPGTLAVVDDPTGLLGGKVVRIDYDSSGIGSNDRAVSWNIKDVGGNLHRLTYGDTLWVRTRMVLGPTDRPNAGRKIIDMLAPDNRGARLFVFTRGDPGNAPTWRWTADWCDESGVKNIIGYGYSTKEAVFGAALTIELRATMNSAPGVGDASFDLWVNGALVSWWSEDTLTGQVHPTGSVDWLEWINDHPNSAFSTVHTGSQLTLQGIPGEEVPGADKRHIGELAFSTTRIGP